jgi:hypothetical protein
MKEVYIIQPYLVGSKLAKSIALIIPSQVAKYYNISTETAFALRTKSHTRQITLQILEEMVQSHENMTSAGESFEASNQQIS